MQSQELKNFKMTFGVSMGLRSLYFNSQRTVISLYIHFPIPKVFFFFSKDNIEVQIFIDNSVVLETLTDVNRFLGFFFLF